jgi:hypothetical protein
MMIGRVIRKSIEFYEAWSRVETSPASTRDIVIPDAKILEVLMHGTDLIEYIASCSDQDVLEAVWMLKILIAEIPTWMIWYKQKIFQALEQVSWVLYLS